MYGFGRCGLRTTGAVVLMGSAVSAADLSFQNTQASPGTTVVVNVEYRAQKDQVAAMQFDVLFDPTEVAITAVNAGPASSDAGKVVASNLLAPGRMRVLIFGLNQNVIGDGIVASLTAVVAGETGQGPSRLDFDSVVGASPGATEISIRSHFGHIVVLPH